jgi:hypothetical protein
MPNTPDSSPSADQQSRVLGGLVVLGAVLAGSLFLAGVFSGDSEARYWALAIPVGAVVLFVLALVIWIGWTILTVHTEPSGDPLPSTGSPGGPTATPIERPAVTSAEPMKPGDGGAATKPTSTGPHAPAGADSKTS